MAFFLKLSKSAQVGLISAILGLLFAKAGADSRNDKHPNIVFILSDDQGTVDLNCYGAKDLQTPNLDKLASEGIRFTQFYAMSALCSPSRASIMTGRYPTRVGVESNAPSNHDQPGGLPP